MMMREGDLWLVGNAQCACKESASCGVDFETRPFRLKIFRPKKGDLRFLYKRKNEWFPPVFCVSQGIYE